MAFRKPKHFYRKKEAAKDRAAGEAAREELAAAKTESKQALSNDAVGELVKDAALHDIVRALPVATRQHWTSGHADWEVDVSTQSLDISIKLSDSHGNHAAAIGTVPRRVLLLGDARGVTHFARTLGRDLADNLIDQIKRAPTPKPKEYPKLELSGDGTSYAEPPPKAKVGKLGPLCLICGPENRERYPEWPTCPHGVTE